MRRLKVTKWTSGLKTGSGGGSLKKKLMLLLEDRRAGGEDLTDEFVRESSQEVAGGSERTAGLRREDGR